AFLLLGGGLGWEFLAPPLLEILQARWPVPPPAISWSLFGACAAVGAFAGWLLGRPLDRILGTAFRLFNVGFQHTTEAYIRSVGKLLRVSVLVLLVYGGLLGLTYWNFTRTPTGFIPAQDKGYLLVNVQLPDAASVGRTREVMDRIEAIAAKTPGVKHTVAIAGQSILLNANAPNFGALYVMLDDFHHRDGPGLSADEIGARLQAACQQEIPDGLVNVFGAPPVDGLGTAGGFKIIIEDRGGDDPDALQAAAEKVVEAGSN